MAFRFALCLWLQLAMPVTHARISTMHSQQERQLEDFVEALMECRRNLGVALAMVKDGETVYAEGFGIRDDELPMESNTKINIASITKSFTGTLTADLVHSADNELTWDTPLQDILGEDFELEGPFRTEQTSFRDIYSHRLGMPNYWGVSTAHLPFSREELCMDRLRHFTAFYDFRNRYTYSNWPWLLGGYVTEQITGLTWEDHVRLSIFEPLGMTDTKVSSALEEEDWNNLAYSYTMYEEGFKQNPERDQLSFMTYMCPAGCIFSTAEDMAKYMKFHISEGQNEDGDEVVPSAAMEDIISPNYYINRQSPRIRRPVYPVDETAFTYGLGLTLGTYRGMDMITHSGSYSSYNCRLSILKEALVGVWACVNSPGDNDGSTAVRLLNLYAMDVLLGEEPWLNETTGCSFPAPWEPARLDAQTVPHADRPRTDRPEGGRVARQPLRPLDDYVGQYDHPGLGIFNVYINDSDSDLYYNFGLLLSGRLDAVGEESDDFYMSLDYPLDYRMQFYPQYPNGFPLYFIADDEETVIESVRVPYLEFDLPPVFHRTEDLS